MDAACAAIGRDPSTLVHSVMTGVLVGRTEEEVQARGQALLEAFGDDADDDFLEERRDRWVSGAGEAAREMIRRFAAAGAERIMLQDFIPWDLDHIDAMGELSDRTGVTGRRGSRRAPEPVRSRGDRDGPG